MPSSAFSEVVGFIAASLTTVAFIPQVVKAWKTKSTGDLSGIMMGLFFAGVFFWMVYGIMLGELPIILTNVFIFISYFILIYLKIKYK